MAPRAAVPRSFPQPRCGVTVRLSTTDLNALLRELDFGHRLVKAMRAEGEGYSKVQSIGINGLDVQFVTADAPDSGELWKAMNKRVPASLRFKPDVECTGLIQEHYMLNIFGYQIPSQMSPKDVVRRASKDIERHFSLKRGQITDYKFVGREIVRIITCDLEVLYKFYEDTDDFSKPMVINSVVHAVKPTTKECQSRQCYNCQRLGHTAPQCTHPRACSRCSDPHTVADCSFKFYVDNKRKRCVNCVRHNETAGPVDQLSISHEATNLKRCRCPEAMAERARIVECETRVEDGEVHWLEFLRAAAARKPSPRKRKNQSTSQPGQPSPAQRGTAATRQVATPRPAAQNTPRQNGSTRQSAPQIASVVVHSEEDDDRRRPRFGSPGARVVHAGTGIRQTRSSGRQV